jgi:23S rRNA (guanosine2251-2'-O)-methyltransferase
MKKQNFKTKPKYEKLEEKKSPSSTIFGIMPVLEALRSERRNIEQISITEGANSPRVREILDLSREKGIIVNRVAKNIFFRLVEPNVNHQGIAAVISAASYFDADKLIARLQKKVSTENPPLAVIVDSVEDPRNLGAILRTVEAAGADGVFIPERRAVGLNETVVKSSAGATEYVKVAKVGNLNRLIDELRENNIWVVGTDGDAEKDYTEWDWRQPTALVLGSEGKGLHRLVAEKCDLLVKIPMQGKIESLNVSVAAGVILFEAIRQRAVSGIGIKIL